MEKQTFFPTFFSFSIRLHKEHCETNAFLNFRIHLHKEHCETSAFSMFLNENTLKPIVFQHF